MNTTALFAEILAIGIQALTWMFLALVASGAVDDPSGAVSGPLMKQVESPAVLATVILAWAYSLGVVVDKLADRLSSWIARRAYGEDDSGQSRRGRRRAREATRLQWGVEFATIRLRVAQEGGHIVEFLDYLRSRLRIARATMLNLIPVGVFGAIVAADWTTSAVVAVLAVLSVLAACEAWLSIDDTYGQRLFQAYELIEDPDGKRLQGG